MPCVMGGGEMRLLMSRLFAGYSLTRSPYGLAQTSIHLFSDQWEAGGIFRRVHIISIRLTRRSHQIL